MEPEFCVRKTNRIMTFALHPSAAPTGLKIKAKLFTSSTKAQYFSVLTVSPASFYSCFLMTQPFTYVCVHEGCKAVCVCVFSEFFWIPSLQFTTFVHPVPCAWNHSSVFPPALILQVFSLKWHLLCTPQIQSMSFVGSLHQTQSFPSWLKLGNYKFTCMFIYLILL